MTDAVLDRRDLPLRPLPKPDAFQRIRDLDVVRGAALVGALVVNLAVFSIDGGASDDRIGIDRWAIVLRAVLSDGRWYPVFAFLFGHSLALQLRSGLPLRERRRRLCRRLAALGSIGVAHALFLYRWDILFAYAVVGAVVYAVRQTSTRKLLMVSVAFIGLGGWVGTESSVSAARFGFTHVAGPPAVSIYQHGSLFEVIELHVRNHPFNLTNEVLLQWPMVFAMMLLGLLAERHLFFSVRTSDRLRPLLGALGAAAVLWAFVAEITGFDLRSRATAVVSTIAVSGQALGAVVLFSSRRIPRRISTYLATLGRMSLTNYLAQSVICTTLVFGYGFGLGPHLRPSLQLVVCALIITLQVAVSSWWLRTHQRGPVEAVVHRFAVRTTRRVN